MAIEYDFTLDMDRSKRDNNIAYARTGDIDSIVINADLVFNGAAYTPSGTNAFFECITPNGRSIRAAAEKTGSSVSVEVPPAAFQAAGVINVAYFRFETGETDSPTYVESTEPFAIVVREGIGDSIDAGDYIEEWRKLADHLEAVVADVEQKAEQAETAINEQKTEVDQLKAQAQKAIAGDVTDVNDAAQSAITAINQEKADVANAAEGITEAGEQAINKFNTDSQQAVNTFNENSKQAVSKFNTDSASAISKFGTDSSAAIEQFNSKGTTAIDQFNTDAEGKLGEVDDMITEAQGDVDAAITQLETATSKAVDAMEDALDGTTAGSLQNAINRTLKLDIADMTNIPDNASLSSFTNVGSYCCKTAATAATIGDCPVDDSPFNMYVFSSATSGQVMQLVVPIDLQSRPTAEWHVRFGTSSAMDSWSVIGGGADIAAGLGIDVTGDAQKTVSLDTEAFYQHHEAALTIQGSDKVTGGGRIKELRVKGRTVKNLWPAINRSTNGVTVSTDKTGLITVSGTATANMFITVSASGIAPSKQYALAVSSFPSGINRVYFQTSSSGKASEVCAIRDSSKTSATGSTPASYDSASVVININSGTTVNASFRVMLVEGSEAPDCFVPTGLHSVKPTKLVTAGKNLATETSAELVASGVRNKIISGPLVPGTYTFSANVTNPVALSLSNGTISQLYLQPDITGNATFTVPAAGNGLMLNVYVQLASQYSSVTNIQLELGSTPTSYEPPNVTTTPLPEVELRGLPDGTCDELVIKSDGTCEVERRFKRFDSKSSGWREYNTSGDLAYINISTDSGKLANGWYDVISELPVVKSVASVDTLIAPHWAYNSQNLFFRFPATEASSLSSAISYMESIGAYCYAETSMTTEPQSPVTLPVLPAPTFNVYATGGYVPAEIEAEVVKVDYLPPSDAYTREEVDKKIKDAGMPEVVPVSQGGTGVTTAAAERNRLGLGNTTGALPIANGGTGATASKAAQYNLLNSIAAEDGNPEDSSLFTFAYASPSSTNGALYKRTGSNVWNWIASKIRSTFGFNSSNVLPVANGGTGSTTAKAAQNSLLNDMNVSSDALTDSSMLVGYNASPSASSGAVHRRAVSTIWDYVVGKIRSTFGFSSSNVLPVSNGGTGLTDNPSILVNLGSESASEVLTSLPRPGVTGTLPVSHGGTGATSPGVGMLSNLGITFGTAEPPSTGTPGSIYIQYFE